MHVKFQQISRKYLMLSRRHSAEMQEDPEGLASRISTNATVKTKNRVNANGDILWQQEKPEKTR